MRALFDMDNAFFRGMSKVADLCILNVVFLICCIPVFTIGAATTALSYVTLKMKDGEEGYILKSFFKSFRQNFKQSTVIWLLMVLIGLVLGLDFYILRGMSGTGTKMMLVVVLMGVFLWLMVFSYVFPLQARFYNTIKATLRNAVLLSIANFPRTICMVALQTGTVLLTFYNGKTLGYGLLAWFLIGFAAIALANSTLLSPVLKKLMPAQEDSEAGDSWTIPEEDINSDTAAPETGDDHGEE